MQPVRNVGLATDLELARMRGSVDDRGDYLVVRAPDDPGYFYGNLIVAPAAPQVGEVAFWTRRFADAFADEPRVKHVTLAWDGIRGDLGAADELRAAGFELDVLSVLTASADELAAPPEPALPLRELTADELVATADLAWEIGDRHDEGFRSFLHRRAHWHHDLVARGAARFFGVWNGDDLVASCGVVMLGARARYQDVQTAEAQRGRGFASAVLAAAADRARAAGAGELVIVAQPGSAAERLYTRLGFTIVAKTASATKRPQL